MQPVYPLTAGLSNLTVSKAVREVMEHVHLQKETLPESIRQIFELCEYNYALKGIHFPTDENDVYAGKETACHLRNFWNLFWRSAR